MVNSAERNRPRISNASDRSSVFGLHAKRGKGWSSGSSFPNRVVQEIDDDKGGWRKKTRRKKHIRWKRSLIGATIWKVMLKNALKDSAKKQKRCILSPASGNALHGRSPDTCGRLWDNWRPLCSMCSDCSEMPCIRQALDEQISHGQSTLWHDQWRNGSKIATIGCWDWKNYINQTKNFIQFCQVVNQIEDCKLGFFQDASFASDLRDFLSTSGSLLCVFGPHTYVPISWMCKKQTAVSHSSAVSDFSPGASLRVGGSLALQFGECLGKTIQ